MYNAHVDRTKQSNIHTYKAKCQGAQVFLLLEPDVLTRPDSTYQISTNLN